MIVTLDRPSSLILAALACLCTANAAIAAPAGTANQGAAKIKAAGNDKQKAKQLALIRLLARAGKHEEAAAGMRALYPDQPPAGDLALEYYRIIGNTPAGWDEAKNGLEKLAATSSDMRYRLALALHLSTRPATRRAAIQTLTSLSTASQPGAERKQAQDAWRSALLALEHSPDHIGLYRDYLAVDADNTGVREALADAQRADAERQPWLLRDQADAQLKEGHPEQAMATLQHALQLAPKNPWVRFDLSRLYHKQGDKKQGRALIEAGLSVAPDDADMLYACALYLGLLDETDAALRLLEKIPATARTPSISRLQNKLAIKSRTQQAIALAQQNRRGDALAHLDHAATAAGDDAEFASLVANAYLDINEASRGLELLRSLLVQPSPSAELRLYYAALLNRAERNDELAPLLDQLDSSPELSDNNRKELRYLQSSLAAHRADQLRHAGDHAAARAALNSALLRDPENTDLLMALARVQVASHEPQQARDTYKHILEREPGYFNARLALARAMSDAGDQTGAQREMATMLANTPADDFDKRMAIADWYTGIGNIAAARTILKSSQKIAPDNPRVLVQAGRIAQADRRYAEALDDFKRANAADEIASMERRRASGYVTAGVDYLSKTDGTPGISNLTSREIPIEMRVPIDYAGGQAFVQIDPVSAEAGVLQLADLYNLRQYGKVLALAPGGLADAPIQAARGTALAVGYQAGDIRADIGSTPLGFAVTDVLGGIKCSHYTETSGMSFDVSRRPVTSSLLSYAGVHDPVTDEVWGGVRSSGASLHVSRDYGRLNGFVDLGYHWLTGRNVLGNTESALRTGFDWSFIREENMRLTGGVAITDWHYRENLRYYTFGHGGYYSPQKYYSLALPFRWTGRQERWSYLLQGSASISVSYEKDMPFYPTDAALQAQGIANSATMVPVYTGGDGHGTGYSFGGALEYRYTPQLFVGGRLQIDRSAYYTPNFAILYLRYRFDAHNGAVPYPPEPVKAYSRY
ncbi:MAG: BCSC C-terminal domain-containing protein [Nitrosomonadales bacterium]|nr:BCSC C-terminal domain-containing protein [Nitrosomonadales bacterium]